MLTEWSLEKNTYTAKKASKSPEFVSTDPENSENGEEEQGPAVKSASKSQSFSKRTQRTQATQTLMICLEPLVHLSTSP